MVFIAFSNVFVDSGFSSALIQKKNALASDFSTVFFFNLIVSIILYISIFFCAGLVANFYNQSLLTDLLRVLTLILIINSFSLVQNAQIVKNLNFKVLTKASVLSSVVSGIIGISLAFFGMGVWSLVFKTLSNNIIYTGMLWFFSKWKPSIVFDIKSFKEMFSYGWKLLVSGMLYTFSQNLFYLIIGKIYSPSDLGYYAKANSFSNLASSNITISIQKVTFPTLSRLQDDGVNLLKAYKKLLKSTIFITTFSMGMLFVIAEPSIIILIGEKWRLTIPLLKILCFGGLWYPINSINLNLLQAKGRSDLFLKLSIIKNTIFGGRVYF
jgi:O-antigen/teichoic acid export membrane protein